MNRLSTAELKARGSLSEEVVLPGENYRSIIDRLEAAEAEAARLREALANLARSWEVQAEWLSNHGMHDKMTPTNAAIVTLFACAEEARAALADAPEGAVDPYEKNMASSSGSEG